jgi:hypothetical protein
VCSLGTMACPPGGRSTRRPCACVPQVLSWGRHGTAQGLWTHMASTGSASHQLAAATLLRLRAWCGPCRAGGGLSPPGTGSLDVLLGVHGAVGSWVVRYACRMASVRREVE